jgi:3-hydroxyisobutyrate dehydrogenase-like beta-hydroxyacid dehydrogenase
MGQAAPDRRDRGRGVGQQVTIGVLGLGEAGGTIAADAAAAGATIRGYDPDPERDAPGIERLTDPGAAAEGADVVLSVNAGSEALTAARSVAARLGPGQLFADLNSAGPPLKRAVAEVVEPHGAAFADVALMMPVLRRRIGTPALASGPGAERFAELLRPLGMPVEVLGPEPGAAARRKLLRSVFMKGIAAAAIESLRAGAAAGCEDWLRADLAAELEGADAGYLERLVAGSERHALRRAHEVRDAGELLRELGVEPRVTRATGEWLSELAGPSKLGRASSLREHRGEVPL